MMIPVQLLIFQKSPFRNQRRPTKCQVYTVSIPEKGAGHTTHVGVAKKRKLAEFGQMGSICTTIRMSRYGTKIRPVDGVEYQLWSFTFTLGILFSSLLQFCKETELTFQNVLT
ncbi:hypothetical protein GDO81_022162 [Engystomops pustulosus]|uniref:Uncharacterized protein n=1 Tax=Engystomops pustulosus TaxID=76066 RepID=A0AAV6YUS7_ENGPU|nr:hypothetical protein GDO81_022162 [Engystomops pustulosus]